MERPTIYITWFNFISSFFAKPYNFTQSKTSYKLTFHLILSCIFFYNKMAEHPRQHNAAMLELDNFQIPIFMRLVSHIFKRV